MVLVPGVASVLLCYDDVLMLYPENEPVDVGVSIFFIEPNQKS